VNLYRTTQINTSAQTW